MKILLASGELELAALLKALTHVSAHEITHCADGARAIVELLRNGYDWAIINGLAVSGSETDIARFIRTMDPDIQENPVMARQAVSNTDGRIMRTSCGVEWSKEGILQLHCGLHALLKDAPAPWQSNLGCTGDVIFEYHAPCGKARRHNG